MKIRIGVTIYTDGARATGAAGAAGLIDKSSIFGVVRGVTSTIDF